MKSWGSRVNSEVRNGNTDRRCSINVKNHAKSNKQDPPLREFRKESKSCVSQMDSGDFYENEKSYINCKGQKIKIVL